MAWLYDIYDTTRYACALSLVSVLLHWFCQGAMDHGRCLETHDTLMRYTINEELVD
ncbi:hypothetical protein M440DRAFT_1130970 [Trichoderma longibrachiatum ATCC 18648]|uniref:Uncharacterized protein n=1 Tax=Trichoderma longibrachiatum ATCC 18648 TaxID=983965 RepID=A0A2T4CGF4_TRILO|nr:hypothetical protein M440DRAFT_1130970 [Trichoderma longibrachiatum ATCC 18648]